MGTNRGGGPIGPRAADIDVATDPVWSRLLRVDAELQAAMGERRRRDRTSDVRLEAEVLACWRRLRWLLPADQALRAAGPTVYLMSTRERTLGRRCYGWRFRWLAWRVWWRYGEAARSR